MVFSDLLVSIKYWFNGTIGDLMAFNADLVGSKGVGAGT